MDERRSPGHLNGVIRFWDITGEKAIEQHPIVSQPVASPFLDLVILPGVVATRDEQNSLRLWKPTTSGLVGTASDEIIRATGVSANDVVSRRAVAGHDLGWTGLYHLAMEW